MADFLAKLDPVTGKVEWVLREHDQAADDHGDFAADLLASSYGDMLHDTERNVCYAEAIVASIQRFLEIHGRPPRVLDIGTGTGLLAMLAARSGATDVLACEAFLPMVSVGRQVVADNGFSDQITVVPQRSTDLEPLPDAQRAELVVSEILDTELIGEGVLGTMRHAHSALLAPNAMVIPASATVRAQLVNSKRLQSWNNLSTAEYCGVHLGAVAGDPPGRMVDVHADALEGDLHPLCDVFDAIHFDFTSSPDLEGVSSTIATPTATGTVDAILLWWDAHLDAENCLSTAPPWVDRRSGRSWRDHWRQAVYLLAGPPVTVEVGVDVTVTCTFDEYSLWFTVGDFVQGGASRPVPSLSWALWSPTRVSELNCPERKITVEARVRASCCHLPAEECLVSVGDGSVLALAAAHVLQTNGDRTARVFSFEPNEISRRNTVKLVSKLKLSRSVGILDVQELSTVDLDLLGGMRIGALIGEPYYLSSLLPWHALQFWYACDALRPIMSASVHISPRRARLVGMCVEFDKLQRIQAPVDIVAGFNLKAYDAVTAPHAGSIFPVALWEYQYTALTAITTLIEFDFFGKVTDKQVTTRMPIVKSGHWNGVVSWIVFDDADEVPSAVERQAVQLVPQVSVSSDNGDEISLSVAFTASDGDVTWTAGLT